jgi:Ser/Thr protein kinase RdoA (MazF antagonist)
MLELVHSSQAQPPWSNRRDGAEYLRAQAEVQSTCSRLNFPAPYVFAAKAGSLVSSQEDWSALLTQHLDGLRPELSLDYFLRVGMLLGQLHTQVVPSSNDRSFPNSWWYPLEDATKRLLFILPDLPHIPVPWQTFAGECQQTLEASHVLKSLPVALIHGDIYPGNVIAQDHGQLAFIDWEMAGWGPALLDLASLLNDAYSTDEGTQRAEGQWIEAAIMGYQRFRKLTSEEKEHLLAAVRFSVASLGAIKLHIARQRGWDEAWEVNLRREQERLAFSREIAAAVQSYLL